MYVIETSFLIGFAALSFEQERHVWLSAGWLVCRPRKARVERARRAFLSGVTAFLGSGPPLVISGCSHAEGSASARFTVYIQAWRLGTRGSPGPIRSVLGATGAVWAPPGGPNHPSQVLILSDLAGSPSPPSSPEPYLFNLQALLHYHHHSLPLARSIRPWPRHPPLR